MKRNLKKTSKFVLSIIIIMSMSSTVFASTLNERDKAYKIIEENVISSLKTEGDNAPVDKIILPNHNFTKEEFENQLTDLLGDSSKYTTFSNTTLYDRASQDYSDSEIVALFSSDVTWGIFTDLRVNGFAQVIWRGHSPRNCDKIAIENTFTINGIKPGFSFASGNKWTVSAGLTSAKAAYTDSFTDEYSIIHDYANVDFDGYELYLKQNVTGRFTFGTSIYQVTAVDSTLL